MIRRLPVVVGALALASSLGVARADHIRISGGVHWSGGVSVGWSRPVWRPHRYYVGGSIYVGPTYTYTPRPYYVYYPVYVPSYYQTTSYYPVEPAPQGPSMVAPVAPAPRPLPRFGIGAFLGGSGVEAQDGGTMHDSRDMGLLARFRLTPGFVLEGELGKTSYDINGVDNARVDRRLGASLLYEIGAYNRWAPYVLVGLGVQQADVGGGEFQTTQDFAEIGAGLRWAISRNFHLAADIRLGSRDTVDSNSEDMVYATGTTARVITPPTESSSENEEYTRFRLSAFIYF